jgi:hypothetical protein
MDREGSYAIAGVLNLYIMLAVRQKDYNENKAREKASFKAWIELANDKIFTNGPV